VLERSGTDAVDGEGELVTRISAARSAKVMGPNLDWAVVRAVSDGIACFVAVHACYIGTNDDT
jgi:hypothetical protein